MEIWFLQDMNRLELERSEIKHLAESAEWLRATNWVLDGELGIDATIYVHGHNYQVRLSYPTIFPSAPPTVSPIKSEDNWSTHQYSNGTLCLEWGPDNWHPGITGAQVLKSAYKLLHIENPLGSDRSEIAPSRHHLSLGQTLRNRYCRFYVGKELANYINNLPNGAEGKLEFSIHWQSESCLALIQQIKFTEMSAQKDISIPKGVCGSKEKGTTKNGVFYTTRMPSDSLSEIRELKEIEEVLNQAGIKSLEFPSQDDDIEDKNLSFGILLIDSQEQLHFFLLFNFEEGKVFHFTLIISDSSNTASRIPIELQELSDKSVCIVGLGSIGSKIAVSLARMGVSRFLLVDEDIFLPENVCRHVLDWQNIGEHKVDAIKEKLHLIASDIEVDVSPLHLTGQESTSGFNATLDRLGKYDLIINATANARVFNLTAAVAKTYSKPLVWMEVFAGGIGGLIARSRPQHDPNPHSMKAAYHQFAVENPAPQIAIADNYTAFDPEDENILSASDADVGVIASQATRLAVDTLLKKESSVFPYSMYLIGLSQSWVFKAPFHTIPIDTSNLPEKQSDENMTSEMISDNLKFLGDLVKTTENEDSSS